MIPSKRRLQNTRRMGELNRDKARLVPTDTPVLSRLLSPRERPNRHGWRLHGLVSAYGFPLSPGWSGLFPLVTCLDQVGSRRECQFTAAFYLFLQAEQNILVGRDVEIRNEPGYCS